ncbi:flagellar filament capping protein FliD [Paenibacillus alkalitolerans]|uniref:flagellar filament capping protein FliD n=1 Tax=Paenibacillus alkalitolerans TaxID=2799335 RepID=UPI0018F6756A|nr:flagellar filament capping protein FliD [Paenibacillus alkalitolerans]
MNLRIGGLASGIDTDQIIRDLMKAHRIPVDQMRQKKQLIQWQRDAYKEINAKLLDFRNNTLFNLKKEATLAAKTAIVTGNTAALTATATGSAIAGTLTVEVHAKATAASNRSSADIRNSTAFDPSKPLTDEIAAGHINGFTSNTFSLNGKTVTIESGDSLNSVIEKINRDTNVTAFYDSVTGKVSIVSKNTGKVNGAAGNEDKISLSGDFLSNTLKIAAGSAEEVAAVNADVTINGIRTERTGNTFDVNGVTITLNTAGGAAAIIEVKTNTDAIINSIAEFIDAYNEMNTLLYDKLNEQKFRDYPPLTDEQRKELSENEIELWEEKAKSGLLRRDTILEQTFDRLRYDASGSVSNGSKYNMLSTIGIETGNYLEHGRLILKNEEKLRKAVEEDPQAVLALFTADGNGDSDNSDVGIMERMYTNLEKTLKDFSDKAGTSRFSDLSGFNENSLMGRQLQDIDNRLNQMLDRLKDVEDRYYRQFSAMETAIQRFNSQSAYLASQFGTGAQ